MKEFVKKFDTPSNANDYSITDIPFMTTAQSTGQNLCCTEEGKKISVVDDVMSITDDQVLA